MDTLGELRGDDDLRAVRFERRSSGSAPRPTRSSRGRCSPSSHRVSSSTSGTGRRLAPGPNSWAERFAELLPAYRERAAAG
jgi:hypothetical protein